MNNDFFYFFNLFKDDNDFNDALNTIRYRYGINPMEFQNMYSQYEKEWNQFKDNIEEKVKLYTSIEGLNQKEKLFLFSLIKVISDSRDAICNLPSDSLMHLSEILSDLIYLIIKLVLQMSAKEFSAPTVRCTKVKEQTEKKIDSKTNTQLFKNSFLHHIFSDSEKICNNTSLPIRVLFAPVQFAALKTINICPYKYIYDCHEKINDARFHYLSRVSDSQSANLMLAQLSEVFDFRENLRYNNQDMYTRFSLANLNTFCKDFSEAFSVVVENWGKLNPEIILPHRLNAFRIINDYISERIFHFGFYQQFSAFLDKKIDEYLLDYNKLLSVATLDNVFYSKHLLSNVEKKRDSTDLNQTPKYNKSLSPPEVNPDSPMMTCQKSVDLLNYIYYPTIFTLSYSLATTNSFSSCELIALLEKMSSNDIINKHLDSINVSKNSKGLLLSPSRRNRKAIESIINDSLYIINRRYYSNTSPYSYYFLHTFSRADSPLVYPPRLIPEILPPPARLNSDECSILRSLEIADREKTHLDEAQKKSTPEKTKAEESEDTDKHK